MTSLVNIAFHWLKLGFTLPRPLDFGTQYNVLKGKNIKKCIRIGITVTVLKIVIWGGKSSV